MPTHTTKKRKPRRPRKPKPKQGRATMWPSITKLSQMIRREAIKFKYNNPEKDSIHCTLHAVNTIIAHSGITNYE